MNYLNIVLIPQACQRSHENSTRQKINKLGADVFVHAYSCVFVHVRAVHMHPYVECLHCRQMSNSTLETSSHVFVDVIVDCSGDSIFYLRNT